MRFCNARMALLTSALAANAVTNTAKTDDESATSRTVSSPAVVHDDLTPPVITATQSVDDEDRGWMPTPDFAKLLGLPPHARVSRGLTKDAFVKYLDRRMTPKQVYDRLNLRNPKHKFLSDDPWIKWIFLLIQLSRHLEENEYQFIMAALSSTHDAKTLAGKLLVAANDEKTKPFAIDLIKADNEEIKSRFFKKFPSLVSEVYEQKQQPSEVFRKTLRDRIDTYLKTHVTLDKLEEMECSILISYLSVLFDKDHAVSTGQRVAYKCFEDAALLKLILSLENFDDRDYMSSLVSIYLNVNIHPFKIVSMLVQDVPEAQQFDILFKRKSSRSFWLRYLEMYNERNQGNELTRTAMSNFEQLLQLLNVAAMKTNAPRSALSDTAISAWLKVLTSPQLTHLETSQRFRNNLMSIWRNSGILPSKIVSTLMLDEAEDKCFTILFENELSRSFWVRYFEQYIQNSYNNVELMQSATVDFKELVKTLFAVATDESHAADKSVAYGTILKLLTSPYSTHFSSSHERVVELTSILLLERTLPSNVVSMLTHGEADAEKFKILFVNKSSKNLWVRYLKSYFEFSSDAKDFASTDFQHLLIMLNAVGVQKIRTADEFMVRSTFLKILVSPEIASIVDQSFLNGFVSAWLNQRIPPSEFVSWLVLKEAEADYFRILFEDTPSSKLWEDYTKAFYADPPSHQDHMVSTLVHAIDDAKLERILNAASTDEAMSEKAKALLAQLDRWKL